MQNYRKTSHTTYDRKYHIVRITKYYRKGMIGVVVERVGELIPEICKEHAVKIIRGPVAKNHAHLLVSVAISKLAQYLKGKSSHKLTTENKRLSGEFLAGTHEYFVAPPGNVTDEIIMHTLRTKSKIKDQKMMALQWMRAFSRL